MKYIQVRRSDVQGNYIETKTNLLNMVDGEFDDLENIRPGTFITLTVVEMTAEEYANLPEFTGW